MKINWGWGITIGMVAFISFIMFFVITMITGDKYDYDLVSEEYYEKEMLYQNEIDAEENLDLLSASITGEKTEKGWLLHFPDDFKGEKLDGTVHLYRTSNKQLDFKLPLQLENSDFLVPDNKMLSGRWNITIDWQHDGKDYLYKDAIIY